MKLPEQLTLLPAASRSRARIYRSPASKKELMAIGAAYGQNSLELLAKYDPVTQSLRTSQTCLLDLVSNPGRGLAEYSQTWPASGMMRNGKIYQRQPWALPIAESVSGLLPTPRKVMGRKCYVRKDYMGNLEEYLGEIGLTGWINPSFVEKMMGFPETHTELEP